MQTDEKTRVDRLIFAGTFIFLIGLVVPIVLFPEQMGNILTGIKNYSLDNFGWAFLIFTLAELFVCIGIAVSKIGKTKMGAPNEKPEFSTFSWISMLFCAGQGSSIIYWGCIEWAHYYIAPPPGYEALSVEAANVSTALSFLHWGPSAWAIYCIPAIPMTYLYWRRKDPVMRLSQTCCNLIPSRYLRGKTGSFIDLIILFVILISYVATLGLATPMVATALEFFFGWEQTVWMKLGIILVWSAIFCTSVYKGINSGMQNLSRLNVYIAFALLGGTLVLGPTSFIFNKASDSIGIVLQNYLQWSLFTDAVGQNGFAQSWTVFYFAWAIIMGPFMGLWVAKISKGRSLREIIIAELVVSSGCALLFFSVLGGAGVYQETIGGIDIVGVLESKGPTWAIVTALTSLPLGKVLLVLMVLTMFLNLATSLDATAFVLAQLSCKNIKLGAEPPRWYRMFWAFALVVVPVALIISGQEESLSILQTFIITPSMPTLIFTIIIMVAFFKMIKEDRGLPYEQIVRNHYCRYKPEVSKEEVDQLIRSIDLTEDDLYEEGENNNA